MSLDTKVFDTEEINNALVYNTLNEVYDILKECGYDPINQLVGYIMNGDPDYITSQKEARKRILIIERSKII